MTTINSARLTPRRSPGPPTRSGVLNPRPVDARRKPPSHTAMTRYLTLVLLVLGCSGAPDTDSPQDTPVHTGGAPAATGGAPGLGGEGGLGGSPAEPEPAPEPEEPAPEPWKPEPRPEPLPGRPGFGDPCQRPSDCEIPGVTGENSMICHAGRCGFFCDRLQGSQLVVSEYLERLCVSDYERVCASTHTARVTCTR